MKQHVESLAKAVAELDLSNSELCTRERLLTELRDTQENFIDRICCNEVARNPVHTFLEPLARSDPLFTVSALPPACAAA